MSTTPTVAPRATVEGFYKAYKFKRPPRLGHFRLALRGVGSSRAGWRDGRYGIPDSVDDKLPANVQRRVDQANAWMNGPLARRYASERNRLEGLNHQVRTRGQVLHETAQNAHQSANVNPSSAPAPPTLLPARAKPTEEKRAGTTDEAVVGEEARTRWRSTLVYLILLGAIFGAEAIINKKAFELFSESDAVLWLMVSGLTVGVILAGHHIGRSWKSSHSDHRARPMLVFLALLALGAAVFLGTMRYLSVDNTRQERIRILSAQVEDLSAQRGTLIVQQRSIERKRRLSVADREALRIVRDRRAVAETQLRSTRSLLRTAKTPNAVERATIAIPIFMFLNVFLIGIASVMSYYHYDPAAEKASKLWWARLAHRIGAAVSRFAANCRDGRTRRMNSRSTRAHAKALARHNRAVADQLKDYERRQSELGVLAGATLALDATLEALERAYRYACVESERRYGAVIARYWESQNRQAKRRARRYERVWNRAMREAAKNGLPAPTKPDEASWRRPASQDAEITFTRPAELT